MHFPKRILFYGTFILNCVVKNLVTVQLHYSASNLKMLPVGRVMQVFRAHNQRMDFSIRIRL